MSRARFCSVPIFIHQCIDPFRRDDHLANMRAHLISTPDIRGRFALLLCALHAAGFISVSLVSDGTRVPARLPDSRRARITAEEPMIFELLPRNRSAVAAVLPLLAIRAALHGAGRRKEVES